MLLYHATTRAAWRKILEDGRFRCDKSQSHMKRVWACAKSRVPWACLHVVRRHGGRIEDVVVIRIQVPRRRLRRGHRQLWYTELDVQVTGMEQVTGFRSISESEVTE
jgi:RNA:NAD 2'-phosphotransferase (TPT1/KptA family)